MAAGGATTLSGVPATVTVTPELVNVTCTDDAVPGDAVAFVPVPITTTTDVALEHRHDAAGVPELGVGPTLAVHGKPAMKLLPVIVIVPLT